MILIIVVRLKALALEPCPFHIRISVLPLNLVHHIGRHAQDARRANVAMVIGLKFGVLAEDGVFDDECCLVGQSQISLGVNCIYQMGTASVLKVFGFLPVHIFVVFGAVMSRMLHISR